MSLKKDLTGLKFGKLTVINRHSTTRNGHIRWLCSCDCGREAECLSTHLLSSKTKSCGCSIPTGKDHKMWKGCGEITGRLWGQITRGADGSKGRAPIPVTITIEEVWELFLKQSRRCALSGELLTLPPRYNQKGTASLDRIDSNGPYSIENVQWVHKDINLMKNKLSQDRFILLCKKVAGACEI